MKVETQPENTGWPEQRNLDLFDWWRDLSEEGQILYQFLLGDVGDMEILPEFAEAYKLDLVATLEELRSWGILDEDDPTIIRIKTHLD